MYDSKHIFKKGKGKMGSSSDNNNEGAKFSLERLSAINIIAKLVYLGKLG
jgi:hypothetical protein